MAIRKLSRNDIPAFIDLLGIFKEIFELDGQLPDHDHLGKLLADPDFMVFVVKYGEKVVGGLTVYVLHQYHSVKPVAYICDVGIAPAFQRQGMGTALLGETCRYCAEQGFREVYVEAEMDDIEAVGFYRTTHFQSELNTIHFTYTT